MGSRFFNPKNPSGSVNSGEHIELNSSSCTYDLDSEAGSREYATYTVHLPPTPDNRPSGLDIQLDGRVSQRVEEHYTANSIFTGGHNSVTRAHLMDKVAESEASHPQMAGSKGSTCAIPGCDAKIMTDERGEDILPCECDFKICRDCYVDAVRTGDGICPGCKEPYKGEFAAVDNGRVLTLSSPVGVFKEERRLSLLKSSSPRSTLMKSQTAEFDHNGWLFETKGTYGYGNAIWPEEGGNANGENENACESIKLLSKPWRPLTRKLSIRAAVLSPYRYNLFSHSFSAEERVNFLSCFYTCSYEDLLIVSSTFSLSCLGRCHIFIHNLATFF